MKNFGDFLKESRESKRPIVSMRELARRTNVDPSYISRIEKGENNPSRQVVISLAKALDENVNTFLIKAGYVPFDEKELLEKEVSNISEKEMPSELREVGVEYIALAKEFQDSKIPPEDIKKILDAVKNIKKTEK